MKVHRPTVNFEGYHLVESHGPHAPLRIILHDTESHDSRGIRDIEGVCNYWHSQGLGYGSHILVDSDGLTGMAVAPSFVAWHTARRNTGSLGIEQIGFARFSNALWWTRQAQLHKVAKWCAWWSKTYDIPLQVDIEHGISTHAMQSRAFGGDHYDPGKGYPLGYLIRLARKYYHEGW